MKTKVKAPRPVFRCPFCDFSGYLLEERNEHIIERHESSVRVLSAGDGWGAWEYKREGMRLNSVI